MSEKYKDLFSLIENDKESRMYYSALPYELRTHIKSRAHNVNSFESLKDYAENLLRGDI